MGSVIGAAVWIKGEILSREDLRLDGEAEGLLQVDGRLTVGQQGKAHANITAREVVMSGKVEGNIEASERVVLTKGSELTGDVKTAGIVIEDGAFFKGGIDIVRPAPAKAAPAATSGTPAAPTPSVTAHSAGQ
jgi:cytoskeletal protein CcmA (bactofilin family)